MRNIYLYLVSALTMMAQAGYAQRSEKLLQEGWSFHLGETTVDAPIDVKNGWEEVTIPHDWAIKGPFDRENDIQVTAITQNGEKKAVAHTARTAGLPYMGIGWYQTTFDTEKSGVTTLVFDGAMSEAHVYVNGKEVIFWPYGYNTFQVDVTDYLTADGKENKLAVRLQNRTHSSRWYPGAGLYRNVHLIHTQKVHIPVWGTHIVTPHVDKDFASVTLDTRVDNHEGKPLQMITDIIDAAGKVVAHKDNTLVLHHQKPFQQHFIIEKPQLWSPETPNLYRAVSKLYVDGQQVDEYTTTFGVRTVEYIADKGFYLNGQLRKFQGVCLHHDLGPLGSAINESAIRHQLKMLREMGCDAIRTSHNMPAPELVRLCDEMGFMMMVEPFDEWDVAKVDSGYHRFFNEWAQRDLTNMIHQYRNNACVVMWSVGNEVPTQGSPKGASVATFLQDIFHREDPTRLCTCGMDQVSTVLDNGFASVIDIPGLNYRTALYEESYRRLPQNLILGSENSSCTSSRGAYEFPVKVQQSVVRPDHQATSYDVETGSWCNMPETDFALMDDFYWTIGQFVWTGFDYLGEPFPYDTEGWPSHGSYFGIIDLASIPKDRYYLYQSQWKRNTPMLHVLPHWTWPGREGETTPVMAYSTYDEAELFVNGISQGRVKKLTKSEAEALRDKDPLWLQRRYRLIWDNVKYHPGEITVKAYDAQGNVALTETVKTAGKPHHLELVTDCPSLKANGQDLAYIYVRVVDRDGNLCPTASNLVKFQVQGAGTFRAAVNGDAANLDMFHLPQHHAFNGMLTALVQSTQDAGDITLTAVSGKLKGSITITSK